MKTLITFLTIALFSFGASADKKTNYFVKNCLNDIWKNEDQSKNKIVKDTLRHSRLVDLHKSRKQKQSKNEYNPCYEKGYLEWKENRFECESSYYICITYDIEKPWGERLPNYSQCYMDANGEVNIRYSLFDNKTSIRPPCSYYN